MRLINTATLEIHEFPGDSEKKYAILSHTWDKDECTFQDMATPSLSPSVRLKKGFAKLEFCCKQAARDGLEWAWADTCCIDQSSTTELSEAINSMFRWYSNAVVCYAYLVDVTGPQDIFSCRWITRGWTLQELIAPDTVRFYSSDWTYLGSKIDLQDILQQATGIDKSVLSTGNFNHVCVARRMAWAANRTTTRVEDRAYSLMGIFNVYMPLLYGEGENAFLRLQQEILNIHDDKTLFAWGLSDVFPDMSTFPVHWKPALRGLFADSPKQFSTVHEVVPVYNAKTAEDYAPPVVHGKGLRVHYPVCKRGEFEFVLISCTVRHLPKAYVGIPMQQWAPSFYGRCGPPVLIFPDDWAKAESKTIVVKLPLRYAAASRPSTFKILRVPDSGWRTEDPYMLDEVWCSPTTTYNHREHSIGFSWEARTPHAAIFFQATPGFEQRMDAPKSINPIHRFAIVLGHLGRSPWVQFVPIIRASHADADFHRLLRASGKLVRYCTTKEHLKEMLLREEMRHFLPKADAIEALLAVRLISSPLVGVKQVYLELVVDLDTQRANLAEDTTFVSIKLRKNRHAVTRYNPQFVRLDDANPTLAHKARQERLAYRPDWITVEQWKWFQERAPK